MLLYLIVIACMRCTQLRLSQDCLKLMRNVLEYQEEIIESLFACLGSCNDKTDNNIVSDSEEVVLQSKSVAQKILLDNFKQRESLKDMNLEVDKKGNTIAAKTIDKYESIVKNMINVCLLFCLMYWKIICFVA